MKMSQNLTDYTEYTRSEITEIKIELQRDPSDDIKIEGKTISIYSDYDPSVQGFIFKNIVLIKRPNSKSVVYVKDSYSKISTKDHFLKSPDPLAVNVMFRDCIRGEVP
jgi:hypothetical protein